MLRCFVVCSGGTAVSLGGGPGSLRRGRGQVDWRSAEAGRRGEEDSIQAVLLWGKVLHVHIITEYQRTAKKEVIFINLTTKYTNMIQTDKRTGSIFKGSYRSEKNLVRKFIKSRVSSQHINFISTKIVQERPTPLCLSLVRVRDRIRISS